MSEPVLLPRTGPSLRVARFTVENFRAITSPVVLQLGDTPASGDPLVVLHGRNGSGKSTALLALAWCFDLLRHGHGRSDHFTEVHDVTETIRYVRLGRKGLSNRDLPEDPNRPLRLRIEFTDPRLGTIAFEYTGVDGTLRRSCKVSARSPLQNLNVLSAWIGSPYGPSSTTFDSLDSRRYASWVTPTDTGSLLQTGLAEKLFALRTSREPIRREKWRYFTEVLQRFEPFQGKLISIDRLQMNAAPELTFESRGSLILGLDDLSSGEQQVVATLSAILLSDAAILSIEEPELNLDATNQSLLREILADLVERGFKDQIFLESHVATFDAPGVIRFERENGVIQARRALSSHQQKDSLSGSGAKDRWATADGYTKLPGEMIDDLRLHGGGPLWFVRGERAWEAWREDDLAEHLGDNGDPSDG